MTLNAIQTIWGAKLCFKTLSKPSETGVCILHEPTTPTTTEVSHQHSNPHENEAGASVRTLSLESHSLQ